MLQKLAALAIEAKGYAGKPLYEKSSLVYSELTNWR
jgi:hypothetical protein